MDARGRRFYKTLDELRRSVDSSLIFFILSKLFKMTMLLVILSFLAFLLLRLSPLDPVQAYIGADLMLVGPEQRDAIAAYWGLDKSPIEQYLHWGRAILQGELGTSMIYRRPVSEVISERLAPSLALMAMAWISSGILGFLFGIIAAMRQGTWLDRLIKWYCLTFAATPTFWLGLMMLMIFAVGLGWFPIGLGVPPGVLTADVTLGQRLSHMVLPAITLSLVGVSNIALHTRQKLLDVLQSDFILFARARGYKGWRLLWRHGLRNIALPAITLQFLSFSELFGGSILAEQVFSYPGLGHATVQSGLRGDVPLLLAMVLFSAIFVFVGNLIADLLYRVIDPRIRDHARIGAGRMNER